MQNTIIYIEPISHFKFHTWCATLCTQFRIRAVGIGANFVRTNDESFPFNVSPTGIFITKLKRNFFHADERNYRRQGATLWKIAAVLTISPLTRFFFSVGNINEYFGVAAIYIAHESLWKFARWKERDAEYRKLRYHLKAR